jgi:hypothetical protein
VVHRASHHPLQTLVDLAVFAPVGFIVEAPRLLPELIETGRARIAGLPGGRRLSGVSAERPVSARDERRRRSTVDHVLAPDPGEPDEPDPADQQLPIPAYDQLAASQVVARLDGLDADDLLAVERYERAHRRRRTVLAKIAQLRKV